MKYRKLPVVIEAFQLPAAGDDNTEPFLRWADSVGFKDFTSDRDEGISIHTLEGEMRADPGDWIIKGVKGEFYPCKPDIFAAIYEPAEDATEPENPCEGCGKPATHSDSEGVPLCKECYDELPVIKDEAQADPYASPNATTDREKALFKSVACGLASQGMLHDESLKDAVYEFVVTNLTMWERELAAARATIDGMSRQILNQSNEIAALRIEYESRADWIAKMLQILGCENKDGLHYLDPFNVAQGLVHDRTRLETIIHMRWSFWSESEPDGRKLYVVSTAEGEFKHGRGREAIDAAIAAASNAKGTPP